MNESCPNCATHVESDWMFCPHCGFINRHEPEELPEPPAPAKSSLSGAYGGLLFGVLAMPVLVICGGILLITGVGALLGLVMIAAGIAAPLLGPLLGLGGLHGKCPWCGGDVSSLALFDAFSCPACKKMIAVKKRTMVKAA